MRAAVVTGNGLVMTDAPKPSPGPGEVLVRLRAIGLNRADLGVAAGHRHGNQGGPGAIPGIEGAGEVVEVGPEVPPHVAPGMRVMASMSEPIRKGIELSESDVIRWPCDRVAEAGNGMDGGASTSGGSAGPALPV